MTEQQIINAFQAMCVQSIDPDSYSCLKGIIIPQLERNRHDLNSEVNVPDNCDHEAGEALETFECSACRETFAGVPSNLAGECRRCASLLEEIIVATNTVVKIEGIPFQLKRGSVIYGTQENYDLAVTERDARLTGDTSEK